MALFDSVLVTGANRGIGFEFVRQFVESNNPPRLIFATARTTDNQQELENLRKNAPEGVKIILIQIDVTRDDEIKAARQLVESEVGEAGLQLLINNAGILQIIRRFPNTTEENLVRHFETNTVGPIKVFKEFYPLLLKSASRGDPGCLSVSRAAVLNISSMAGSLAEVECRPRSWLASVGYRTSKAALNMSMRMIAATVRNQGILVVNICPGWVKTTLGGEKEADIDVEDSVSAMIETLATLEDGHQGAFIDRHGKPIPF